MDKGKELLTALVLAIKNNNVELINKYKYENLFYGSNLLDVIVNFLFLSDLGVEFDFGYEVITKGTKLYRIRKFEEDVDFNDPSEWSYNPKKSKNRANLDGEAALYLGTTETVCLLETHIKENEKYAIGEYIVEEDIRLGGFLHSEDKNKPSWTKAGMVLNAFLIAPSRSDKNQELFKLLDENFSGLTHEQLNIKDVNNPNLSLKFGVINRLENYYEITNHILKRIKEKYKDGVSYSSCYLPIGTVDIRFSDHNIVLYEQGISKIKFNRSEIKINDKKYSGVKLVKLLIDSTK